MRVFVIHKVDKIEHRLRYPAPGFAVVVVLFPYGCQTGDGIIGLKRKAIELYVPEFLTLEFISVRWLAPVACIPHRNEQVVHGFHAGTALSISRVTQFLTRGLRLCDLTYLFMPAEVPPQFSGGNRPPEEGDLFIIDDLQLSRRSSAAETVLQD